MPKQYWMVKQEPEAYAWGVFLKDKGAAWTGIRNFQARNYLRSMRTGDLVLYYHTGDQKRVVGLAQVIKEAYPDATAEEGDWSAVDLKPVTSLANPVSLQAIKHDPSLKDLPLIKHSRLSVMPVTEGQFHRLLTLSGTAAGTAPNRSPIRGITP